MKRLALLVVLCCASSQAQLWSGVLASNRATDWTFAGISGGGGIPSGSWTQCGPTIAAGASSATVKGAVEHTLTGYIGCGNTTYVKLGAGTFVITFCSTHSNTELRGMGADQTFIVPTTQASCGEGLFGATIGFDDSAGEFPGGNPTSVNWTAGFTQNSNQITVANAATLSITLGTTMLVLDQCDTGYSGTPCTGSAVDNGNFFDCGDAYHPAGPTGCSYNDPNGNAARAHRWQEEIVLVTACSPSCGNAGSTVLTINTPLIHPNWGSVHSPQVWAVQGVHNVGIRDMSIDNSAITSGNGTPAIAFTNAHDFWISGVRVVNAFSQGVVAYYLVCNYEISSNYIYNSGHNTHGTDPNPNDPSNLIFSGESGLIANNILQSSRIEIGPTVAPATGNAIVANFMINAFESNGDSWGALWDGHQNGTDFNLYESNVTSQVYQDQTHGAKLAETFYRNFVTGWESCSNGNCTPSASQKNANVQAIAALSFNRYGNFIGNILGTPGVSTAAYKSTTSDQFISGTTGVIFNWESGNGCSPGGGCVGGPIPIDTVVGTTSMLWGNWDAFNAATRWNTAEVPSGISVFPNPVPTATCTSSLSCPASFYYTSRPSWWASSIPFPAIGPDISSGNVGQCGGTFNTPGQYKGVPATNASQCASQGLTTAWAGHINAIPAMTCFLNVMSGPPDGASPSGVGSALTFNANTCFAATPSINPSMKMSGVTTISGSAVVQ